ncbi:helix-turn-helix transcriptional regulator [Streptomyces sp. MST-110588]|uniref:helix-turn-helix domain-containing protein n=1 Tax=Streptomyces sp. MST-110588 TaxID=2833628 RepID=UPI001F5CF867|nr:helix-turn-helix transcriptional regulator [Streptomyces sp. MST-110588]
MASPGDSRGHWRPQVPCRTDEFMAQLRHLKDHAGLTYRQLEQRAAAHGDVLARSTIADVLRRPAPPRPDVLAAYVRACGCQEAEVREWLAAGARLEGRQTAGTSRPCAADTGRVTARVDANAGEEDGGVEGDGVAGEDVASDNVACDDVAGDGVAGAAEARNGDAGAGDAGDGDDRGPVGAIRKPAAAFGSPSPAIRAAPIDEQAVATPGEFPADTLVSHPPRRARPSRRAWLLSGAAASVLLLAVAARLLTPGDGDGGPASPAPGRHAPGAVPTAGGTGTGEGRGAGPAGRPPDGLTRIRPAAAPGLCLSEATEDRTGGNRTMAGLRPCSRAVPPRTYLVPVGHGRFLIKWTHPDKGGPGCLTVLREHGAADGLLEPYPEQHCSEHGPDQRLRIERVTGTRERPVYRMRPAEREGCIGLRDGDDERAAVSGALFQREPCTGGADQRFLIGLR